MDKNPKNSDIIPPINRIPILTYLFNSYGSFQNYHVTVSIGISKARKKIPGQPWLNGLIQGSIQESTKEETVCSKELMILFSH